MAVVGGGGGWGNVVGPQTANTISSRLVTIEKLKRCMERAQVSNPIINLPLKKPTVYAALTAYTIGQVVASGGKLWACVAAGTTGAASAPTGTLNAYVTDGTVKWQLFGVDPGMSANDAACPTLTAYNGADNGVQTTKYWPACATDAIAQAINGAYKGNQGRFQMRSGNVIADVDAGQGLPYGDMRTLLLSVGGQTSGSEGAHFAFDTDAPIFAINCIFSQPARIIIDGRYYDYGYTGIGTGSGLCGTTFDFTAAGGRRRRSIVIEFGNGQTSGVYVNNVNVTAFDTIWTPSPPDQLKMICMGDSFLQTGTSTNTDGWYPHVMGHLLGISHTWSSGISSTGWIATGSTVNFGARLQSDVLSQNPDIVCYFGSVNDNGQSGVQTEVTTRLRQATAALPNALHIVFGVPTWVSATTTASMATETSIQNACAAASGVYFIPVSGDTDPWLLGTGGANATTGNGNNDVYLDGTGGNYHPTNAGNRYLAYRGANAIRSLLTSLPG